MVNFKLHLYFPGGGGGWVGVVIIKLKANLSSTGHLTSQLELSLAIIIIIIKLGSYLRLNDSIDLTRKEIRGNPCVHTCVQGINVRAHISLHVHGFTL